MKELPEYQQDGSNVDEQSEGVQGSGQMGTTYFQANVNTWVCPVCPGKTHTASVPCSPVNGAPETMKEHDGAY